jgi:hypothetical protein
MRRSCDQNRVDNIFSMQVATAEFLDEFPQVLRVLFDNAQRLL